MIVDKMKDVTKNEKLLRKIEANFHLKVSLLIIYYIGTWPPQGKYRSFYIFYAICSFTFMLGIFLVTEMANVIMSYNNLARLVTGATLLMTNCTHAFKVIIILYRQKRIQALLDLTRDEMFGEKNKRHQHTVTKYTWQGIYHHIVYQSFGTVAVFCWGITPIADLVAGRSRRLPMEGWYPYNVTSTPAFQVTACHQAVAIIVACFHNVAMDTLITGLITVACCQLEILSQNIISIQSKEKKVAIANSSIERTSGDSAYRALKECIKHGNMIFSFILELQSIFGTVILLQFFVNCIIICLIAFNISQMKAYIPAVCLGMFSYMCCMTYQIFIFCWHGNELQLHSTHISTAAYSSNWLNTSKGFKRALQIMIIRTRRPFVLRAGKIFFLSLNTFVSILRMSYSIFTVLQSSTIS